MMNRFRSKVGKLLAGFGVAALLGAGSVANASSLNASNPALNINDFDVFIRDGAYERTVAGVDYFNFVGWGLSDFGQGAPNVTGATFTDYILLQGNGFQSQFGAVTGTQLNNEYEITVYIKAQGVILNGATGTFAFTSIDAFQLFVDTSIDSGFGSAAGMAGFFDGNQALQPSAAGFVNLTGVTPIANTGSLNPVVGAGGDFNLQFGIEGVAGYASKCFILVAGTNNCWFDQANIASLTAADVSFAAANIDGVLSGTTAGQTVLSTMANYFGVSTGRGLYLAQISTSPDTNIARFVPEPSTLALFGATLIGLFAARRRSRG